MFKVTAYAQEGTWNGAFSMPKEAILCEKNMMTKNIYITKKSTGNYIEGKPSGITKLIQEDEHNYIDIRIELNTYKKMYLDIVINGIKNSTYTIYDNENGNSQNIIINLNKPTKILGDLNYCFYCIPEETKSNIVLQPMPKIDKLIDSDSLENISNKLQEINNLLKVSSDNLKTIMDAKFLLYEETDKFTDLIKKLSNKPVKFATLVDGKTFNKKFNSVPNFKKATEIKFMKGSPNNSGIDLSLEQDKSIMGAFNGTVFEVVSEDDIYANQDCSEMFYNVGISDDDSQYSYNVKTIRFDNFNTSKVTNMGDMFYVFRAMSRSNLVNLYGIENWDVSNVTDMHRMFYDRSSLTSLDLSKWRTDSLTVMNHMFYRCSSLKTLDVSNFNVSNATIMGSVFKECSALTNLDLSKWKFNNVQQFSYLFYNCSNLNGRMNINAGSNFNGDYIFNSMFEECSTNSNTKFIVSYEDDSSKAFAQQMINTKSSNSNIVLQKAPTLLIDGKTFNKLLKKHIEDGVYSTSVYFGKKTYDVSDATDVSYAQDGSIIMYHDIDSDITGDFNTISIESEGLIMFNEDSSNMFEGFDGIIDEYTFHNIDTSKVKNMSCMFKNSGLSGISKDSIDTSSVLDTSNMFEGCKRLFGGITIKNHNLTKFDNMFLNAGGGISDIFVIDYIDEETEKIASQMKLTGGTNIFVTGEDMPSAP